MKRMVGSKKKPIGKCTQLQLKKFFFNKVCKVILLFAKKDQTFITLSYPSATHYLLRISFSLIFLFVFNLNHFEINKS